MNDNWQEFLVASGARVDKRIVSDFGDIAAELIAARDATIVAPLAHLGLIEFAGEEAKSFLHTQLTSDVNHLDADSAQYSAWCTAKGRMLASFLLYRRGPDYRALLASDLLAATEKRLQMFVLRSRVTIADQTGAQMSIGVAGPQAEAALRHAGLPVPDRILGTAAFPDGTVIRIDSSRWLVVVDSTAAIALWPKLAVRARPVGTPAWQWLDIRAGIPLITDATKEEFVPQMANFDKIGGVSFHKGCYPGQEIVARAQYLGKIKRHLYPVRAASAIAAGTTIISPANPEHPCGMLVNTAPAPDGGFVGLAVVQENFVAADDLELGVPGRQRVSIEPSY